MSARRVESWGVMAAALIAVLVAGPLLAQAPDPELAAGVRQVSEGDFEGAVLTLDAAARRLAAEGGPARASSSRPTSTSVSPSWFSTSAARPASASGWPWPSTRGSASAPNATRRK